MADTDYVSDARTTLFSLLESDAAKISGTSSAHKNLNDYRTPGNYKVTAPAYVDNSPSSASYRLIVMQTSVSDRVYQIAFVNAGGDDSQRIFIRHDPGTGNWVAWRAIADRTYVNNQISAARTALEASIEAVEAELADKEELYTKRTYNLLDVNNLDRIQYYIQTDTLKYSLQQGGAYTLVMPCTAGKTYTFTRKNAGYCLTAGCGTDRWNDKENHTLLNYAAKSSPATDSVTITAPEGAAYLYVYYYNANHDESYDATLEEAMITEGSEVLPYAAYRVLDVTAQALSEDVSEDIQKGVDAYNTIGTKSRLNPWESVGMTFGVEFDLSSNAPEGTRVMDAAGTESSDFDNIFPWCAMRRCNVSISGGVKTITYEGDDAFETDGSNGNVFVEIPAFYVCRVQTGTAERWLISGEKKSGFELHPWFVNADGTEAAFRYYGAYKASDGSSGGTDDGIFSASGRRPYSNSAVGANIDAFPTLLTGTGFSRNSVYALSAIQYLFTIEYATRNGQRVFNGSTYNPFYSPQYAPFEEILSVTDNVIEMNAGSQTSGNSFAYYTAGMQVHLGTGGTGGTVRTVTDVAFEDANGDPADGYVSSGKVYLTVDGETITIPTGETWYCAGTPQTTGASEMDSGEPSGYADGQDSHVAAFRYRWIENPWGTIWEALDGLRFKNGKYYIASPAHFRDAGLDDWQELSYAAPASSTDDHSSSNWIKKMGFDPAHRAVALPTELFTDNGRSVTIKTDGGDTVKSSVTLRGEKYWCDAYYSSTSSATVCVPVAGGGWDHHENAGPFCLRIAYGQSSDLNALCGERITC